MFERVRHFFSSMSLSGLLNFNAPPIGQPRRADMSSRSPYSYRLNRQHQFRVQLKMENWQGAVDIAENPNQPRRWELYNLYRQAMRDETLLAEVRKANIMVQRAPFNITKRNKPNEEATKLFDTIWFKQLLKYWLETEFWGHSLVELWFTEGVVEKTLLIPREHVRPEYGDVVGSPTDNKGIAFADIPKLFGNKMVEMGASDDLGLLLVLSKTVIMKNYSVSDWAEYNEKFGSPIVVVNTASRQESELNELENAAKNLGSSSYLILDEQDKFELLERKGQNGFETYDRFIARKDLEIAKLVNGQTGTSDEKAYVGAAEVHERILNDYTFSRLSNCQDWVNHTLIPFLNENGYNLKNCKFQFTELIPKAKNTEGGKNESGNDKNGGDDPNDPQTPKGNGQKKKLSFETAHLLYAANTEGCCLNHEPPITNHEKPIVNGGKPDNKAPNNPITNNPITNNESPITNNESPITNNESPITNNLSFDWSTLFEKAIKKVFDKKLKAGDIDAATWKLNAEKLTAAVTEGFGTDYLETEQTLRDQLTKNVATFAAFKNHAQIVELVESLTDADGTLKSFAAFKTDAMLILNQYNVNYLQTEYQTAVGSAQMARTWSGFERNKKDYPNLKYETVGDGRVRDSHKKLDGTVLPMDDKFWKEFYPPNGWNCRCDVLQVGSDEPTKEPESLPDEKEVPLSFRHNAGLTGEVFDEKHPFYQNLTTEQRANVQKAADKLIKENGAKS